MHLSKVLMQEATLHCVREDQYMDEAQPLHPQAGSQNKPHSGGIHVWHAADYAANGRFVADLANDVLDLLAPMPGERILDLGCGDGALTAQLAALGVQVTGLDASESMVQAARARGLDVIHGNARDMDFDRRAHDRFDAIFSNAALHWIPADAQPRTLAAAFRALKSGGRFVAEMGAQGNIAAIRTALSAILDRHDIDAEAAAASFFPSPAEYRALLEAAGFVVGSMQVIPRLTPLPGGSDGLYRWLTTFRSGVLDSLPADAKAQAIRDVIALLRPILADRDGAWTADYVRLRFQATRP